MTMPLHDHIEPFRRTVWDYYAAHARVLPWRSTTSDQLDPYAVMVSELMLQQTQVPRVVPKFVAFMSEFPTLHTLATAPLSAVLSAWSGLGYNRRAKFLWQAAQIIVDNYNGSVPRTALELQALPGIGIHTAAAIRAYSYNEPVVFIETNIRTVFIYHFFSDQESVSDAQLLPYITAALPVQGSGEDQPEDNVVYREWYWALMDYGTHVKSMYGNASRQSKAYTRQSAFQGSVRQIRGAVIRVLTQTKTRTITELQRDVPDARLEMVLDALVAEGLVHRQHDVFHL